MLNLGVIKESHNGPRIFETGGYRQMEVQYLVSSWAWESGVIKIWGGDWAVNGEKVGNTGR